MPVDDAVGFCHDDNDDDDDVMVDDRGRHSTISIDSSLDRLPIVGEKWKIVILYSY